MSGLLGGELVAALADGHVDDGERARILATLDATERRGAEIRAALARPGGGE